MGVELVLSLELFLTTKSAKNIAKNTKYLLCVLRDFFVSFAVKKWARG